MNRPMSAAVFTCLLLLSVACLPPSAFAADDTGVLPPAPRLLPEDTLVFARIDDVDQVRADYADSSLGRMLADPQMKPLASDIYDLARELFGRVGDDVGISLDELLAIPSGQVALAAIPARFTADESPDDGPKDESPEAIRERIEAEQRRQTGFSAILIVDAGDNVDDLRRIVEHVADRITGSGFVRREESIGKTTLIRLVPPRAGRQPIEYFERDGCVAFGIGAGTAGGVLERWLGKDEGPSLADDADFASVMSHSLGAEEAQPQLTFYADPYRIVERLVRRGGAAALVWPIVEELGIAKIRGIGGSVFQGGEFFSDLSHLHVVIDPPRDGFFGVLRPLGGDTAPPKWVPADASVYTSLYWDFETTVDNFSKLVDRFAGEGTFDENVASGFKERFDVDLRDELLPTLADRYVSVRWLEPSGKLNAQAQAWAIKLDDPAEAKELLDRARQKRTNQFRSEVIGGRMVYFIERRPREMPDFVRQPEPSILLLDNWFIASDSRKLVERILRAHGDSIPQLVKDPDYQLISSELGGKLQGEEPFLVSFIRSSDMIRQFYEMAKSPDTRTMLRGAAERSPVAQKLLELLQRNELPPYENFIKYFAPSGMFAYDEPNGMHLGSFTLRPLEK